MVEARSSRLSLAEAAADALSDSSGVLIFDGSGLILHSTFQNVLASELSSLTTAFGDRDSAIRNGLLIQGKRYEVVSHYPPLVYGRCMTNVDPEVSPGAAVCQLSYRGAPAFVAITYQLPNTAARLVALLKRFCEQLES